MAQQTPDFTKTHSLLKLGDHPTWRKSARGITMTKESVELGTIDYAIDGTLIFLGMEDIGERFQSTITASDWFPPNLEEMQRATVMDIETIWWAGRTGLADPSTFQRRHCPGSIALMTAASVALPSDGEGNLAPGIDPALVAWTKYRMMIRAMVISHSVTYDEWGARVQWSLAVREKTALLPAQGV